jgi:TIR domain/Pentapeptide repeats (8 copies)
MANPEHVEILKRGVAAWNEWRKEHSDVRPDLANAALSEIHFSSADLRLANLSMASISGADLSGADLFRAKLFGANLTNADLNRAVLVGAHLKNATLAHANIHGARLRLADLGGADLRHADLGEADFGEANLAGANLSSSKLNLASFRGAILGGSEFSQALPGWTSFLNTDLREVKGLETLRHQGPSYIGIDTIYRSGGKIPEIFLRGAGVPENFIVYMKSLAGSGIEFYSCFISYSTKDQEFAERLHADLQANNVRCWFAPHDMAGGRKIHEQIDEAIRLHDKLLLILSPDSIKSAWVETEIAKARKRELRDERRVLFPVRLVDFKALQDWECFDADTGKDSAREVREFFIPDFSDWKNHDSYQKALKGLLKDLKAG